MVHVYVCVYIRVCPCWMQCPRSDRTNLISCELYTHCITCVIKSELHTLHDVCQTPLHDLPPKCTAALHASTTVLRAVCYCITCLFSSALTHILHYKPHPKCTSCLSHRNSTLSLATTTSMPCPLILCRIKSTTTLFWQRLKGSNTSPQRYNG